MEDSPELQPVSLQPKWERAVALTASICWMRTYAPVHSHVPVLFPRSTSVKKWLFETSRFLSTYTKISRVTLSDVHPICFSFQSTSTDNLL